MRRTMLQCCRVTLVPLFLLATAQVHAQCSMSGGVFQIDSRTFTIDVGTLITATGTLQTCSAPFSLPSPGRIVKIQGTMLFRGDCGGDTEAVVSVNGGAIRTYTLKQKLGTGGGVSTVFVSYDIPLSYSSSNASIDFAAFVQPGCPNNSDWEFKGVMQISTDD